MPRMPSPIRTGRSSLARDRSISPVSIRGPTPTANDFPTPQGQVFNVRRRDKGLVSPAQSAFSFADDDSPIHALSTPPTPPDSVDQYQKAFARPLDRGTPGERPSRPPSSSGMTNPEQPTIRKQRSHQFYQEVYAYREPNASPKDCIYKDSIITCEVKTNVIVKDEYELLQDLSHHLSLRYQRPITSICVTLSHSACMLFGGTFDSAYLLTLSALPVDLGLTTNKRNAALLQAFMADALGVAPVRGVVKFVSVPDEDLAFNGTTVLGQIENLQKASDSSNHSKANSISQALPYVPQPILGSAVNTAAYAPPPPAPNLASQPPSDPPSYPAPTPMPVPPPTLAPAPSTLRKRQGSQRDPNRYRYTPKKLPLREGSQSVPMSRAASPSLDARPSMSGPYSAPDSDPFCKPPSMPPVPIGMSALDQRAQRMRSQSGSGGGKMGKRKSSFWAVFGRRQHDNDSEYH